jgi:FkbM family methyltransferase
MTSEQAEHARSFLRSNPKIRAAYAKSIVALDAEFRKSDPMFREVVTGPLHDLAFCPDDVITKRLADGTAIEFLYRSKIAREFAMSVPDEPDHVWEPQTTKLLVHLAKGAKTVVVGGAYFGDQTIPIARELLKSGGIVHAFEPNPDQLAMLVRNLTINELTNVIPNAQGLWDVHRFRLSLAGFDAFASSVDGDCETQSSFETVQIDSYIEEQRAEPPELIMIDLEGAEFRALQGASKCLTQGPSFAPKLVFEIHGHYVDWSRGLENTDIVAWLEELGYAVYAVRDFNANVAMGQKPVELIPCRTVFLEGPPHGFNMLATKEDNVADDPFFKIVPNVSPKLLFGRDPHLHLPTDGLD